MHLELKVSNFAKNRKRVFMIGLGGNTLEEGGISKSKQFRKKKRVSNGICTMQISLGSVISITGFEPSSSIQQIKQSNSFFSSQICAFSLSLHDVGERLDRGSRQWLMVVCGVQQTRRTAGGAAAVMALAQLDLLVVGGRQCCSGRLLPRFDISVEVKDGGERKQMREKMEWGRTVGLKEEVREGNEREEHGWIL